MTAKMSSTGGYLGVYRGQVENNIDPMQQGRVQISVPALLGEATMVWAMPSSPGAGDGVGLFAVPPERAAVWVAFENGDLQYPIVLGGFWSPGRTPADAPGLPTTKVFKTDCITITMNDLPGGGGLTIEVAPPAVTQPITIEASASGLKLSMGGASISLDGVNVSINNGALEVT